MNGSKVAKNPAKTCECHIWSPPQPRRCPHPQRRLVRPAGRHVRHGRRRLRPTWAAADPTEQERGYLRQRA